MFQIVVVFVLFVVAVVILVRANRRPTDKLEAAKKAYRKGLASEEGGPVEDKFCDLNLPPGFQEDYEARKAGVPSRFIARVLAEHDRSEKWWGLPVLKQIRAIAVAIRTRWHRKDRELVQEQLEQLLTRGDESQHSPEDDLPDDWPVWGDPEPDTEVPPLDAETAEVLRLIKEGAEDPAIDTFLSNMAHTHVIYFDSEGREIFDPERRDPMSDLSPEAERRMNSPFYRPGPLISISQEDVERVMAKLSERSVSPLQVVSNGRSGEQCISDLEDQDLQMNVVAERVVRSKEFITTTGIIYNPVIILGSDPRLRNEDRTKEKIWAEGERRGFKKPPAEVAVLLREKLSDAAIQAMGSLLLSKLVVMHEPINLDGLPCLLVLCRRPNCGDLYADYQNRPGDGAYCDTGYVFLEDVPLG